MEKRVIKFRAWDSKEMFKPTQITFGDAAWWVDKGRGISLQFQPHITLMQWTGLFDKNGKEIYEGDINQDGGKVIWVIDSASFCWEYPDGDIHEFSEENEWCEIKGNLYENPELLTPHPEIIGESITEPCTCTVEEAENCMVKCDKSYYK